MIRQQKPGVGGVAAAHLCPPARPLPAAVPGLAAALGLPWVTPEPGGSLGGVGGVSLGAGLPLGVGGGPRPRSPGPKSHPPHHPARPYHPLPGAAGRPRLCPGARAVARCPGPPVPTSATASPGTGGIRRPQLAHAAVMATAGLARRPRACGHAGRSSLCAVCP